jgi:hypothetical protein
MSWLKIRRALEKRLATITPDWTTFYENMVYAPTQGQEHQRVFLLPARSRAAALGQEAPVFESGIFQISIYSPIGKGPGSGGTRAELVKASFARGLTLTEEGLKVQVQDTPSIGPALQEPHFWALPLSVPFFAYVFA